jgi:hypothetical protein
VNSKQIVAVISVVVLVAILAYPALSTGTISIVLASSKMENADHVYALVGNIWIHRLVQSSSGAWELVSNQTQTIDLVTLENKTMMFAKHEIPVGSYDSIRLEVTNVTWVFNGTTTRLSVESTQLQTKLVFTVQAGREGTIGLTLSGHMEEIRGTKFFVSNVNARLAAVPG